MSLQLSQGENNVQIGFIKHRVDAHRVYLNKRPPEHRVTLGSASIGHHYTLMLHALMPILIEVVMLLLFGRKQKSFEKIILNVLNFRARAARFSQEFL